MRVDSDVLAGVLDAAVDALLVARLAVGPASDIEIPADALDLALRNDEAHANARMALQAVLARVRPQVGADGLVLLLELEEAVNEVVARAVDVAYRLGVGRRPHSASR